MNVWRNAVITDNGLNLLAKLTQGNALNITRAVSGKGFVSPDLLGQQTEVAEPMQELKFLTVYYPKVGECALPVALSNEGLTEGYKATQIGIFANDPDEGEILYLIVQTISADIGTIIPSEEEMPGYTAEWKLFLQYGQADSVNVTVDPSNNISRYELEAYFEENLVPITFAEIEEIVGLYGNGSSGTGSSNSGTSGVSTLDHSLLLNRNAADQHTMSSITGLEDALSAVEGTELDSTSIETAWDNASEE